jgi:hypothetical protein
LLSAFAERQNVKNRLGNDLTTDENFTLDKEPAANFFDRYRSAVDPSLVIFVQSDVVPPFRFRAGGWELLQSCIELGPTMKARITEKGFFMCRVTEDQSGWTELADFSDVANGQ